VEYVRLTNKNSKPQMCCTSKMNIVIKNTFVALKSKYLLKNIFIVQTVEQLIRQNIKKHNTNLAFLTGKQNVSSVHKGTMSCDNCGQREILKCVLSQSHERGAREQSERSRKSDAFQCCLSKTVEKVALCRAVAILSLSDKRNTREFCERSRKSHAFWYI